MIKRTNYILNRFLDFLGLITKKRAFAIYSGGKEAYRNMIMFHAKKDFGAELNDNVDFKKENKESFDLFYNTFSDDFIIEPLEGYMSKDI